MTHTHQEDHRKLGQNVQNGNCFTNRSKLINKPLSMQKIIQNRAIIKREILKLITNSGYHNRVERI